MPCATPPWTWPSTIRGLMLCPHPTHGKRSAAICAVSEGRALRGVAVPHLDHVVWDSQGVGDDLRERRVVALAMRMGADVDGNGSSWEHPHLRRFHQSDASGRRRGPGAGAETAYLDPAREADPDVPAVLAALFLLSAQLLVTRDLESLVQLLLIGAGVVDEPEVARVREIGDEVLTPKRNRIHLELVGEQVDHPLA